ncbi:MAG: pyrroline-5-carboxylate reductase [Lysobacterales bacterium]|jgi:pyrroline-5-carboxylate reductase|nr:MAG: pyrroline-5-carboxylate reductase [Xanthomonadales bacterium]
MQSSDPRPPLSGTIGFIGGGNMARALIGGLIAAGQPPASIAVSEPDPARREGLAADFGIALGADNREVAAQSDLLVLAVKPQVLPEVCQGLRGALERVELIVSIAAGVPTARLRAWLATDLPLVRAMPNTPALIGAGVSGLYAPPQCGAEARARADRLLASVGETVWIPDESAMDAVTAVSGSGPAYFLLLCEALEQAAIAQGIEPESARRLVLATALGSARLARETARSPRELRAQVTSPGGTTEAALSVLFEGGWNGLIERAVAAATRRGRELSGSVV